MTGTLISQLLLTATLATALASGCAKRTLDVVEPGKTSVAEYRARFGEPELTFTSSVRPHAKLMNSSDGCQAQAEQGVIVGIACPPLPEEATLQYWRHRWKGQSQSFEEMPAGRDPHGHRTYRLVSNQERMAVIYEESSDRVVQVVKYGSR
jgi:hypothetical protein